MLSVAVIALLVLAFVLVAGVAVRVVWRLWSSAGSEGGALGEVSGRSPVASSAVSSSAATLSSPATDGAPA